MATIARWFGIVSIVIRSGLLLCHASPKPIIPGLLPTGCSLFLSTIVSELHGQSAAASFCTSFLHYTIPAATTVTTTLLQTTSITVTASTTAIITSTLTSTPPGSTITIYTSPVPTPYMRKRSLEYVEGSPLLSIGKLPTLNDSASTYIKRNPEKQPPINGLTNNIISSACSCFVTRPTTQTIQATVTSQVTVAVTATATSLTTTYTTTTLAVPTATVTLASQCQSISMGVIGFGPCGRGGLLGSTFVTDNIPNANVQQCCTACYSTLNCILGTMLGDGTCQLYILTTDDPSVGTTGSAICPHGLTPVVFSPLGTGFLGPCVTETCP